ncbi:NADH-quinone oxidoreductase subunit C [Falsirhodobacter halotolerans]|uniref:NADH-quinone oxidoreductase subunit C n=1 Tax=Falsirhodobacter halotolerans TaxID=1146892 RepID=UPI001FD41A84|nr:NADH-quinone oxidoreductase subunit C [Falsirhodobacter halotolerans]MCJ8140201.1 NADH-quinone oxidoreductase subunit C [Falsirhodobacter halotolerans]
MTDASPDTTFDALAELGAQIELRLPDAVTGHAIAHGQLTVEVRADAIVAVMEVLKQDGACRFGTLIDITAVDYPERPERFDLVYNLLSMHLNHRIRIKCALAEDGMMPSITGVYPAANWYEREVFDMFGILFSGHPDLRRLLTDYGFRGHPLRKDFPTTGYTEVRYDETLKRVVYEPVKLVQEYRQFDFLSPWEGAEYILPGDDKAKP